MQCKQQQYQRVIHNCAHGLGAYNLGLAMSQHVEIIKIYWQQRYYRAFPGPTATCCCSCYYKKVEV